MYHFEENRRCDKCICILLTIVLLFINIPMNMFADSVSDEKKSFITDLEDLSFEVDDMKKDALMVVSWGGLYKIYIDDLLMANSNNTFVAFEL